MNCWTGLPPIGNIEAYVASCAKFPMLTPEEEFAIGANLTDEGKTRLVLSHLRLAASIARKFSFNGMPFADLIQEANIGLIMAAEKFDSSVGRFATFAIMYIRSAVFDYILKNTRSLVIAKSKKNRRLFFNLGKMKEQMLGQTGTYTLSIAQMQQIADTLNVGKSDNVGAISVADVMEMDMRMSSMEFSINARLGEEEGVGWDVPSDESFQPLNALLAAEKEYIMDHGVTNALECLNDREKFIVTNRYSENSMTLHELAAMYGVSAERIRQIEVKALKKMKEHIIEEFEA